MAQVCHRLGGIPLAIELAAARIKALPVEKLAERLDDRFRLLTGGSRTALPRQQTLRALIDWSYDLLTGAERALLRGLSVFAEGWTLEAAEAVCTGDGIEDWEVLDLLTSLVEKSLVGYEERDGEARYRLLETVRQYARDRMLESGEAERLRGRHRDWFLSLAEQIEPQLSGGEGGVWFERLEQAARAGQLETEHDNLRVALEWSLSQEGEAETALRLAGALGWFWQTRGYWSEGQERLSAALARRGGISAALRAKALRRAGQLAGDLSDYGAARRFLEESLAISRELGDQSGIAQSLDHLGWTLHCQGDHATARSLFEECLRINRELGRRAAAARTLSHLGWVALEQGDQAAARALFEEDLAVERELGNKMGIAYSLNSMGCLAKTQGESALSRSLLEESLAMHRELGNKLGIAWSLHNLGVVTCDQGDYGAAWVLLEESLAIRQELSRLGEKGPRNSALQNCQLSLPTCLGDKRGIVNDLERLAVVVVAHVEPERAGRLFGAAEALREAMGAPLPPADRAEHDRSVAAVRAALGEGAFAAAWEEGRAMTPEEAIRVALEA